MTTSFAVTVAASLYLANDSKVPGAGEEAGAGQAPIVQVSPACRASSIQFAPFVIGSFPRRYTSPAIAADWWLGSDLTLIPQFCPFCFA
jgi:hypothetical protein